MDWLSWLNRLNRLNRLTRRSVLNLNFTSKTDVDPINDGNSLKVPISDGVDVAIDKLP